MEKKKKRPKKLVSWSYPFLLISSHERQSCSADQIISGNNWSHGISHERKIKLSNEELQLDYAVFSLSRFKCLMNTVCAMKRMSMLHIKQQLKASVIQLALACAFRHSREQGAALLPRKPREASRLLVGPRCSSSAPGKEINYCS